MNYRENVHWTQITEKYKWTAHVTYLLLQIYLCVPQEKLFSVIMYNTENNCFIYVFSDFTGSCYTNLITFKQRHYLTVTYNLKCK